MQTITRNAKSEAIKLLKQCNGDKKKATDIVIQNLERDEKSDLTKEKKDFLYKFWDDVTDHITEFNYDEYMQIKNIKKTYKRCKYCNRSLKSKHGNADFCNKHHRKLFHMGYTPETAPKRSRMSLSQYIERSLAAEPTINKVEDTPKFPLVFIVNPETYKMYSRLNEQQQNLINVYLQRSIEYISTGKVYNINEVEQKPKEHADKPDTQKNRSKTILIFSMVFLFTYIIFAFLNANYDISTWEYNTRLTASIIGLSLGILLSILNNLKNKL